MARLITDHPPRELAAELGALLRVDWRTVWDGIPAGEAERREWCEAFGWQPLWAESGLWVRTRRGGRLHLAASAAPGRPVTRASYTVWKAREDAASGDAGLVAVALDRYEAHLARMTTLLGPPGWQGSWDSPDFPPPPAPGRWGDAEDRLEHQAPYRLAQWSYANPLAPVFVLDLDCRSGRGAGSGTISLSCHGPADPEAVAGPGWLL
ncbi:hypothetical protein ACFYM0_23615 [Streptomyces sp. NPDC006487]|uniref:hypothetical protein n=1 Tax=Streptomyces sp. NPDC006487 TaxID=3364748 RepID=UPI0036CC9A3D